MKKRSSEFQILKIIFLEIIIKISFCNIVMKLFFSHGPLGRGQQMAIYLLLHHLFQQSNWYRGLEDKTEARLAPSSAQLYSKVV